MINYDEAEALDMFQYSNIYMIGPNGEELYAFQKITINRELVKIL